ncbi:hypothetical protein ACHAW5_000436 [Stephanodiscus triporus]|uniref:Uncharacterized protein n=1 Tax=Stephanodiscus triporus TaxID=2934178 RepID=A0ABD3MG74_9STRA
MLGGGGLLRGCPTLPGLDLNNLSKDEIPMFKDDQFCAYKWHRLDGIKPYTRSKKEFSLEGELRLQIKAGGVLLERSPIFNRYAIKYPINQPEGVEESFFWVKGTINDIPMIALVHRMGMPHSRGYVYMERHFYISRSHNCLQAIGCTLPVDDGVVVLYCMGTSTDQVSGFGHQDVENIKLDGIKPYTRSKKEFSLEGELRLQIKAGGVLLERSPIVNRYVIKYPINQPEGVEESFFWVKGTINDIPMIALVHRMGMPHSRGYVYMERHFYISRSHNCLQAIGCTLPVDDGVVVLYCMGTSTDQVSGFGHQDVENIKGMKSSLLMLGLINLHIKDASFGSVNVSVVATLDAIN